MSLQDSTSAPAQPSHTSFENALAVPKPAFGGFGSVLSRSPEVNPFGKPDFLTSSSTKPQSSEDHSPFGKIASVFKPAVSQSSLGGFGSVLSRSPEVNPFGKPDFLTSSSTKPQSSEDHSPFGKVASVFKPAVSSLGDFGSVLSRSPEVNPFGKPDFLTSSSAKPHSSEDHNPSEVNSPFGKVPSFGKPAAPTAPTPTNASDNPIIVKPPPGAWPDSDMFGTIFGTPSGYTEVNSPSGKHYVSTDPDLLPTGFYQYDNGATLEKRPDGSITRDYGGFRIETDPDGNSIRYSSFATTPISEKHIPKMVGFPREKYNSYNFSY